MITSFDLTADMTIIDSSAVAVAPLQLFATEPILVTLPNGEKEESCHITTFLLKGSSGGPRLVTAGAVDTVMKMEGQAPGLEAATGLRPDTLCSL